MLLPPGFVSDFECELAHLKDYARQNGDSMAFRNAADTIAKLRASVTGIAGERDALKARLAEVEAGAAAMRAALQDALSPEDSGWWCPSCKCEVPGREVTYAGFHEVCGTYLEGVSSNAWRRDARAALSSDAGRALAERVERLEAVAAAARAMHTTGEFVLTSAGQLDKDEIAAIARGVLQVKDAVFPPSYKWRLDELGAALAALEGGAQG